MHRDFVAVAGPARRRIRSPLAAAMLIAFAAPATADLRTPRAPAPAPAAAIAADGYALHAEADFGSVYALFDARRGAIVGLRHTRPMPGIGSYHHRWRFGLEYRHADSLVPNVTFHPLSVGYAGGWHDASRRIDGALVFHRNLPGGRDGDSAAMAATRSGAKAGYAILRYHTTFLQTLPAAWQLRLVAEGQYSPHALVPCEQFALGGRDSLRGIEERALAGDRGQRVTLELRTADFGTRLRPRPVGPGAALPRPGQRCPQPGAARRSGQPDAGGQRRLRRGDVAGPLVAAACRARPGAPGRRRRRRDARPRPRPGLGDAGRPRPSRPRRP